MREGHDPCACTHGMGVEELPAMREGHDPCACTHAMEVGNRGIQLWNICLPFKLIYDKGCLGFRV